MTQLQFLLDWIEVAVLAAFCTSLLLPLALLPFWKWYKDGFGVNLNIKDFAVALALLAAFLHYVFGFNPGDLWFKYVQATAITAIPVILIWRFTIIVKEQRRGARSKGKHKNGGNNVTSNT